MHEAEAAAELVALMPGQGIRWSDRMHDDDHADDGCKKMGRRMPASLPS